MSNDTQNHHNPHKAGVEGAIASPATDIQRGTWEFVVDDRKLPDAENIQELRAEPIHDGETPRYLVEVRIGEKVCVDKDASPNARPVVRAIYADQTGEHISYRQIPAHKTSQGIQLADKAAFVAVASVDEDKTGGPARPLDRETQADLHQLYRDVLRDAHGLTVDVEDGETHG